ncbi:S-layer homology domain-containing protein [Thiolapillus brandeum]|nr:S-layer homology domain-containing protein [Thiolapillus brandeum]
MKTLASALLLSGSGILHANTQTITIIDTDHSFEIQVESTEMMADGSLQLNVAPHYTEMINPIARNTSNLVLDDNTLGASISCNWSSWSMDSQGHIALNIDPNDPDPCGNPAYAWPTYQDVYSFHWAYNDVQALTSAGISSGCDATHFCPDEPVTRAQMAMFLEKSINGSDFIPEPATGMFPDVPADHWAAAWIERLALDEISTGCGADAFCPETEVSRAQMAPLILRAVHLGDNTPYTPPAATGTLFNDIPADYWGADWIEALSAAEITHGCDATHYCPDGNVTRAQMAAFLNRSFQL